MVCTMVYMYKYIAMGSWVYDIPYLDMISHLIHSNFIPYFLFYTFLFLFFDTLLELDTHTHTPGALNTFSSVSFFFQKKKRREKKIS